MQYYPTIRKQPADSVPYGQDISRGKSVFCAYDGETLVVAAASAPEARQKYRRAYMAWRQSLDDPTGV
jgi:hypothetical protein